VLSTALNRALQTQLVSRNVCEAVRPPQAGRPELRVFDGDETRTLLAVTSAIDSVYACVVALAVATGMRQGELLGLRWKDVDLDGAAIVVRTTLERGKEGKFQFREPKTSRSRRRIPIGAAGVEVLRRARTRQLRERLAAGPAWRDADLVFTGPAGLPVSVPSLQKAFYRLLRTNGLPKIRFHDLRHTHASLLLLRGANPKVVSERLGHTTVAFTLDTYAHLLPGVQEDAARDLDAWLRGRA
jgi:integrase